MFATKSGYLLVLFFLCLLCCAFARSDESIPLSLDDVSHLLSLGDFKPALSADGRWLAFVTQDPRRTVAASTGSQPFFSETGVPFLATAADVWMVNVNSGKSINLTNGMGASWGVAWSPNSRYLAFYSDRNGAARLWIYDVEQEKIRLVSDAIVRALDPWQIPTWSPDSRQLLTKLIPSGQRIEDVNRSLNSFGSEAPDSTSQRLPGILVFRSQSDPSPKLNEDVSLHLVKNQQTEAESADLGVVDVASGKTERTAVGYNPVWYSWAPDGNAIVFTSMKGLYSGEVYRQLFDLYEVSGSKPPVPIDKDVARQYWDFSASWSPDGKELSYITTGGPDDGECYILSLDSHIKRKVANDQHPGFGLLHHPPIWRSSGKQLYFVTNDYALWSVSLVNGHARELARIPDHHILAMVLPWNTTVIDSSGSSYAIVTTINDSTLESEFYKVDLDTGAFDKLWGEQKAHDPYRVITSRLGRDLIYVAEDVGHPPDFFVANLLRGGIRRLTAINPQLKGTKMGRAQKVEWRTENGDVVRGALLLPAEYREGVKYPLIVEVYPGLFSPCANQFGLCGDNFFPNKQLFATRGYAVLVPDLRLTGRTVLRDLAGIVLPGINKTIELGIADPDRIALMGTSWGGYSTLGLLVQTTRFKAAVMVAGFGDLMGFYGEMDDSGSSLGIGILEEGNGTLHIPGSPWVFRDLYLENSPIFYLDRIETPLLIIHGTRDANVAPFLSDEVFVGMRRLKKEATYVKYIDEVHGIHRPENQIDGFNRIISWFDGHLAVQNTGMSLSPSTAH